MKKEYIKNYLGIVVQNNDPLKRGRVKVWIPHVDMTVYTKWNETQKNKQFNFVGKNTFTDLDTEILDQLKIALPWAEVAMPVVGSGNTSGIYNAALDRGSISDKSEYLSEGLDFVRDRRDDEIPRAKSEVGQWKELSKEQLNKLKKEDGEPQSKGKDYPTPEDDLNVLGIKPARFFQEKPMLDAFAPSGNTKSNKISNPYGNAYRPMPYSNAATGSFSIPNVGSHVWVFFENGDPLKPVIFAASYGKEDWKSIYDSHEDDDTSKGNPPDYPGKFENGLFEKDKDYDYAKDDLIYRGKYSLNQRGGAITIVNTYDREILNLTHFSGSYKEFNNYTNTELAVNNDQKLVMNDSFLTINGHHSNFIGRDLDVIVRGNTNITYGDPKNHKEPLSEIKTLMRDFHETYNQPFEIQRSSIAEFGGRSGGFISCPTCTKAIYKAILNIKDEMIQSVWACPCPTETELIPGTHLYQDIIVPTAECLTCGGTGLSPSTQDGSWAKNPNKDDIPDAVVTLQQSLFDFEKLLGHGGDVVTNHGKNLYVVVGSEMHDFLSYREDPEGKLVPDGVKICKDTVYQKYAASPLIEKVHVDAPPTGTYTLACGYKYNLTVGSGGISLKTTGVFDIGGSITTITGKQVTVSSDKEVYIDGGKRAHITFPPLLLLLLRRSPLLLAPSPAGRGPPPPRAAARRRRRTSPPPRSSPTGSSPACSCRDSCGAFPYPCPRRSRWRG